MAGTTSISGLVSGLDTDSIITQLMTIEAQPQTDLKTRLSDHQTQAKALQDLNSKIAALAAQASDLTNAATWRPLKATSSSTAVAATATTGTAAGSFDITVVSTAVAHQLTFSGTAKPGDHVTGAGNDVTLTVGGTPRTITSDGTLTGLVNALNAAGTGVKASTISLDDGSKRLIVQAATTGASGAFTLTDAGGNDPARRLHRAPGIRRGDHRRRRHAALLDQHLHRTAARPRPDHQRGGRGHDRPGRRRRRPRHGQGQGQEPRRRGQRRHRQHRHPDLLRPHQRLGRGLRRRRDAHLAAHLAAQRGLPDGRHLDGLDGHPDRPQRHARLRPGRLHHRLHQRPEQGRGRLQQQGDRRRGPRASPASSSGCTPSPTAPATARSAR